MLLKKIPPLRMWIYFGIFGVWLTVEEFNFACHIQTAVTGSTYLTFGNLRECINTGFRDNKYLMFQLKY